MPIGFSFSGIIIRRSALELALSKHKESDESDLLIPIQNLLDHSLADDYLVGIESMSANLDAEKKLLKLIGLKWHDGKRCLDFFIPSEGSCYAPWLRYAKVGISANSLRNISLKPMWSAYQYIDDQSIIVAVFDGEDVLESFPTTSKEINQKNWPLIAKEELNHLHLPSLKDLSDLCNQNDRVCPMPNKWNDLYEIVTTKDHDLGNDQVMPHMPLILGAWWDTTDGDKRNRLSEQLKWCQENNRSDIAWAYLNSLKDDEWHCVRL
jgi:hypothetical protein